MKPSNEEILEKKKVHFLNKLADYQSEKQRVENFENVVKSKLLSWLKSTEFELSKDQIKWDTLEITDTHVYVNSFMRGYAMPLEYLWHDELMEQVKRDLQLRKSYQLLSEELKEKQLYEKLKLKYGG